jgi:hypothetical protein
MRAVCVGTACAALTRVKARGAAASYSASCPPRDVAAGVAAVHPGESPMSISPAPLPDPLAQLSRLASINAALRRLDPDAQVALDPDSGRMKVLTVLPEAEVLRVLKELGEPVEPLDADPAAGGGTSCGCGCRGGQR